MTSIKTYTLYETVEVQRCYFVDASSEEEAKELHESGESEFSWSEEGGKLDIFVEES